MDLHSDTVDLHCGISVTATAACAGRRQDASLIARAFAAALLAWPWVASAQTLVDAHYSRSQDALVVEIAYQGTNPNHEFSIVWDACQANGNGRQAVVGRLIDSQGNDTAQKEFQVRRRFALAEIPCRPADVTLRLGPVSNRSVAVPAAAR
jgi:hypothetical protein